MLLLMLLLFLPAYEVSRAESAEKSCPVGALLPKDIVTKKTRASQAPRLTNNATPELPLPATTPARAGPEDIFKTPENAPVFSTI